MRRLRFAGALAGVVASVLVASSAYADPYIPPPTTAQPPPPVVNLQLGEFRPLNPARIVDTRIGLGAAAGRVASGGTITVDVTGHGGVPASGVAAVALNVTVTGPTGPGAFTLYPSGTSRPVASNLNYVTGQTIANSALVRVGSDGNIKVYVSRSSHVIIDVAGWYTQPGVAPSGSGTTATSADGFASLPSMPLRASASALPTRATSATPTTSEQIHNARAITTAPTPGMDAIPAGNLDQSLTLPMYEWGFVQGGINARVGRLFAMQWTDVGHTTYTAKEACTATVVAKNLVVTAAHCIWDRAKGGNTGDFYFFYAGQYGTSFASSWTSAAYFVPDEYKTLVGGESAHDYGFLVFAPELNGGNWIGQNGWYNVQVNAKGGDAYSYGYPAEGYFGNAPGTGHCGWWNESCFPAFCHSTINSANNFVEDIIDPTVTYGGWWEAGIGCPMTAGSSGGPVFELYNGSWYVSGVNSNISGTTTYSDQGCTRETNICWWYATNMWFSYWNDVFAADYTNIALLS